MWRHWETTWELWKYYFHSSPPHLWKFNFNFNILKAWPFEMITASYIMDVTHSVNEGSYQGEGRVSLFDLTRCSIIFLTVHSSPVAVDHVGNTSWANEVETLVVFLPLWSLPTISFPKPLSWGTGHSIFLNATNWLVAPLAPLADNPDFPSSLPVGKCWMPAGIRNVPPC